MLRLPRQSFLISKACAYVDDLMQKSGVELIPRAAFVEHPVIRASGHGIVVQGRAGLGIAAVLVKRGQIDGLRKRVHERFGINLPLGPQRSAAGRSAFIATGPGAWLATVEDGEYRLDSLTEALGEYASVADQSDGQAVLRVSGPSAREALCKLVPVDLHPRIFRCGDAAVTAAAHIGITIWRLDDDTHGEAVFEIAVYRSFAASFLAALSQSITPFRVGAMSYRNER